MIGQLVASGLALGSIYALLALSLVLINKATDVVNFAQGEMAMFGTFICFWLLTKLGVHSRLQAAALMAAHASEGTWPAHMR